MEKKKFTIGIDIILFIIFLILKLDGIIDWKWIWVFSPLWVVWAVQIIISLATIIWVAITNAIVKCKSKRTFASGPRLVWDAKTNTMYGPCMDEDNETEEE